MMLKSLLTSPAPPPSPVANAVDIKLAVNSYVKSSGVVDVPSISSIAPTLYNADIVGIADVRRTTNEYFSTRIFMPLSRRFCNCGIFCVFRNNLSGSIKF
jgi:hypothetical protein